MKYISLILVAGLFLTACGSSRKAAPDTAEIFFQNAEAYMEKELYEEAAQAWEKVRDSFYSPELTTLAELKLAETYYLDERYAEAATAYRDFLNQYPGDPRRGTATYWLGMSYFQQILAVDRDQTSTRNALATFQDLLRLYPEERDTQEIRDLIRQCRERLAAHEIYVGRFYLRSKQFGAAVKRLQEALENYPDYPQHDQTYFYLLTAYLEQEEPDRAQTVFEQLVRHYPASDYTLKAEKKLKK